MSAKERILRGRMLGVDSFDQTGSVSSVFKLPLSKFTFASFPFLHCVSFKSSPVKTGSSSCRKENPQDVMFE